MTDPISNERLVDALDNLRVHQRQLDADGCEVGVSREALNEVILAFGREQRRASVVTPEMVEAAAKALGGMDWASCPNDHERWRSDAKDALTAALSSEAHNG